MSRTHFYATREELIEIGNEIVAKRSLSIIPAITVAGRVPDLQPTTYSRFDDIPDFAIMPSGMRMDGATFILCESDVDVNPVVQQVDSFGNVETYIRPTADDRCASFMPGGTFGDNVLMLAEVLSEMPSKASERIVRAFATAVKKRAVGKARGSNVTQGAEEFLRAGGLLTDYYIKGLTEQNDIRLDEIIRT